MKLEKIVLKKFLCRFPLRLGGYIVGVIYIGIMVILIVITLVQVINMQKFPEILHKYPWHNAYGYTITGLLYYGVMLFVDILFEWGIYKSNKAIILVWVVIRGLWIFLALCGLLSMVVVTSEDPKMDTVHWIMRLVFGMLGVAALSYGVLVGFSIWAGLRKSKYPAPSGPPSLTTTAPRKSPPPTTLKSPSKTHRKPTPKSTPRSSNSALTNPTVNIAVTTPPPPPPSPPPQRAVSQPTIPAAKPPQEMPLVINPTASPQFLTPHETIPVAQETMLEAQETIPTAQTPEQAPLVISSTATFQTQKPQPPPQKPEPQSPPQKAPAIKPTASIPKPLMNDVSTGSFSPDSEDDVTRRRSRK